MRRIVIVGAFVGVGILVARLFGPELHARLMARCEAMFERAPGTFPPKRMMTGIEDVRSATARIVELLEAKGEAGGSGVPGTGVAHDAA